MSEEITWCVYLKVRKQLSTITAETSNTSLFSVPFSSHESWKQLNCFVKRIFLYFCFFSQSFNLLNSLFLSPEIAELPLIRLDFSCNKITTIPVCYRNLRHLQTIMLENNPLQSPPAQVTAARKSD